MGVLVTHNAFKFTKNNWSRDGTTYWYRCSAKKATGCTASATVMRVEEEDSEGSIIVKNFLIQVSTPEVCTMTTLDKNLEYNPNLIQVHGMFHAPDPASVIVDDLILQMKKYIEASPILPIGMCTIY